MRDDSCWDKGLFFFTPLHFEVEGIRMEVEYMDDADLIDEVAVIDGYDEDERVEDAIFEYVSKGELSEKSRYTLIWYYVTANIQDFLVIDEEEEW